MYVVVPRRVEIKIVNLADYRGKRLRHVYVIKNGRLVACFSCRTRWYWQAELKGRRKARKIKDEVRHLDASPMLRDLISVRRNDMQAVERIYKEE